MSCCYREFAEDPRWSGSNGKFTAVSFPQQSRRAHNKKTKSISIERRFVVENLNGLSVDMSTIGWSSSWFELNWCDQSIIQRLRSKWVLYICGMTEVGRYCSEISSELFYRDKWEHNRSKHTFCMRRMMVMELEPHEILIRLFVDVLSSFPWNFRNWGKIEGLKNNKRSS